MILPIRKDKTEPDIEMKSESPAYRKQDSLQSVVRPTTREKSIKSLVESYSTYVGGYDSRPRSQSTIKRIYKTWDMLRGINMHTKYYGNFLINGVDTIEEFLKLDE